MTARWRLLVGLTGLVLIAGVVIVVAVLARSDATRTYEGVSFDFSYPSNWRPVEVRFPNPELGGGPRSPVVTFGLDRDNWVSAAQVAPVRRPVGPGDLEAVARAAGPAFERLAYSIRGRVVSPTRPVSAGELPAIETRIAFRSDTGTEAEDRLISVYSGRTQYAINCQHARGAPAQRRRAQLHQAQARLEKLGVRPDDAANGMFLKTGTHRKIHTNRYFEALNERLGRARTKDEAEDILVRVQRDVEQGRFPR